MSTTSRRSATTSNCTEKDPHHHQDRQRPSVGQQKATRSSTAWPASGASPSATAVKSWSGRRGSVRELPFCNTFFQTAHPPAGTVGRRRHWRRRGMNHVFFTGSGSEGNDTMLHGPPLLGVKGQPDKKVIISHFNGYHGSTIRRRQPGRHEAGMHGRATCRSRASCTSRSRTGSARGGDMSPESSGMWARPAGKKIPEVGEDNVAAFYRRADPGRRWHDHSADTCWPRIRERSSPVRHSVRGRRSHLWFRPYRRVVRQRLLR